MNIQIITEDVLKEKKAEALLLLHYSKNGEKYVLFNKIDQILNHKLSNKAKKNGITFKSKDLLYLNDQIDRIGYEAIFVVGMGDNQKQTVNKIQTILADSLRYIASAGYTSVAIQIEERDGNLGYKRLGKVISEAFYLSQYKFIKYKSNKEKSAKKHIHNLFIHIGNSHPSSEKQQFEKGIIEGEYISMGVNLARDLTNEPAIYATPECLAKVAREIESKSKGSIDVEILNKKECEKIGMGALLAVTKGSVLEPQFIILHYKPKIVKSKICIIGKGVTFDSGGLSLKPSSSMETMKLDMSGAAVVLGVFKALLMVNQNQIEHEIWGVIPACENMPDGGAIRPGDVITSLSGKTIEILNTDAEGRLILADAITYAQQKFKPDCIIDLATLTGAVMVALGADIAGILGNNNKLTLNIKKASDHVGEQAWILPLHMPYKKNLKSDIADIANISNVKYGGTINGALFLEEFVDIKNWAHIDIAGVSFNERKPHGINPKGGTGWGVRTILEFLGDNFDFLK